MAIGADPQTLFEAASISKVVTGVTVLRLTEQGRLGLDTPVNEMLRSWALPGADASGHAAPAAQPSRRHHGPGFPGYAVGVALPTLAQILDGAPPANTPAVRVGWPPGKAVRYSGGGTMVLQRLVMDVTGAAFDGLARDLVLAPVGMSRSGFFQPLPAAEERCGGGARSAGNNAAWPLPRLSRACRGGLWSTPADLARLALAITTSWRGRPAAACDGASDGDTDRRRADQRRHLRASRVATDRLISITTASMRASARCWCSPPTPASASR